MSEYRADNLFKHFARELVRELELDLAGTIRQRLELPFAFEPAKRPVNQVKPHDRWRLLIVLGREVRFDAQVADMQGRHGSLFIAKIDACPLAPRQERWIILNPVDEIEHLLCRMRDQY